MYQKTISARNRYSGRAGAIAEIALKSERQVFDSGKENTALNAVLDQRKTEKKSFGKGLIYKATLETRCSLLSEIPPLSKRR